MALFEGLTVKKPGSAAPDPLNIGSRPAGSSPVISRAIDRASTGSKSPLFAGLNVYEEEGPQIPEGKTYGDTFLWKGKLYKIAPPKLSVVPGGDKPRLIDVEANMKTSTPQTTDYGSGQLLKDLAVGTYEFLDPRNTGEDDKVNFIDVAKEVPGAFADVVGEPQLRAYAAAGNAIANKLGLKVAPLKPEGQFQQDLFGTDKEITPAAAGREFRGADFEGESKGAFKYVDPFLGVVAGTIDAFDGGILGKLGKTLGIAGDARKIIAGSQDVAEIAGVLKKEIPTLTDNLATALAKPLTVIDDVNDVETVLNRTRYQLQKLAPAADDAAEALPAAERFVVRTGGDISQEGNVVDMVARERFDIPNLKKISFGGSDRDVYDLGNNRVLKVAKSARGLGQNASSADYYAEGQGLIPKTLEEGKNYLVKEKVLPPDENTKKMVSELKKLNVVHLNGKVGGWENHDKEIQKAIEILNRYGYSGDDLMNYDVMWGDVLAIRNWGTSLEGKPIMLDEGTLNASTLDNYTREAEGGGRRSIKNMDDPDFREVHSQSRAAKKRFGDQDDKTMYSRKIGNDGIVDANDNGITQRSRRSQEPGDIQGGGRRERVRRGSLTSLLQDISDARNGRRVPGGVGEDRLRRFEKRPSELARFIEARLGGKTLIGSATDDVDAEVLNIANSSADALRSHVGENYSVDEYAKDLLSIYKKLGLPEATAEAIEDLFKILPKHLKDKFAGFKAIGGQDHVGGLGINGNGEWHYGINGNFFTENSYVSKRNAFHEVYGHLLYSYSDAAFRETINGDLYTFFKNEPMLALRIFATNEAGKQVPELFKNAMNTYYRELINGAVVALYRRGRIDLEISNKILHKAGFIRQDGFFSVDDFSDLDLFEKSLTYKSRIKEAMKDLNVEIPEKLGAWLEDPNNYIANEFFARMLEWSAVTPVDDIVSADFLATDLFKSIRSAKDLKPDFFAPARGDLSDNRASELFQKRISDDDPLRRRVDEIRTELEFLKESVENHPGKDLMKYVSRQTGRLPEVTGKDTMKSIRDGKTEVKNSKFGKSGDDITQGLLGQDLSKGGDVEVAQQYVDDYQKLKKNLAEIGERYKEAKEAVRRAELEAADNASLNRFLNKTAKDTEELARQERVRKAMEAGMRKAADEAAFKAEFERMIEEAKLQDAEPRSFFERIRQTLRPMRGVDNETEQIFRNWSQKVIVGKELGNKIANELAMEGVHGFGTFFKYQNGEQNEYFNKVRRLFRQMLDETRRRGLDVADRGPNYLPQVYAETPEEVRKALIKYLIDRGLDPKMVKAVMNGNKDLTPEQVKRLGIHPFFEKQKVFPDYATAMNYGLTPKYSSVAQLLGHYRAVMEKNIANKEFLDDLLQRGKILPVELAPNTWEAINLEFSPKGMYAEKRLAEILNGMFRDESDLKTGERIAAFGAAASKKAQEIALSAGAPFMTINFFAMGQAIKSLTTAIGHAAVLELPDAARELKASYSFMRANTNKLTTRWFKKNEDYLLMMANEGIDLGDRIGSYGKLFGGENISRSAPWYKKLYNMAGTTFDKAFNEKTFASMLPQMYVQTFKDVYTKTLAKGVGAKEARRIAGETVKNFYGFVDSLGRSKATDDVIAAIFFAPKFRQGLIKIHGSTGKAGIEFLINAGGFRKPLDPALRKNRRLLLGMILTFAAYQYMNKKLNGEYMWENEPGREFALKIPYGEGRFAYVEFMPSFMAFPRNMASGAIASVKGDVQTAIQKFGTVFSMPLKVISELASNEDYFGRPIYGENDDAKEVMVKMAEHVGLSVNHPYIKEIWKYLRAEDGSEPPIHQVISYMLELPLKFASEDSIARNEFYQAIEEKEKQQKEEREKIRPVYETIKKLYQDGNKEEAEKVFASLSEDEIKLFKNMVKSEKSKKTVKAEEKMMKTVLKVRDLYQAGRKDEAAAIYNALSDEDKRIFKLTVNRLPKPEKDDEEKAEDQAAEESDLIYEVEPEEESEE